MTRRLFAALVGIPGVARGLDISPPGPGWKLAHHTPDLVIFTHDNAKVGARDVLAVTELDAPPATVFRVLTDFEHYAEFMPYTKETRVLERASEARLTVYQRLTPPFVDDRDYIIDVALTVATEATGGACESRWTSAPDAAPLREGCVRVRINSGSWLMEPLDGGSHTRLTHQLQTHPGGSIPVWVADKSNTVVIPELFTAIRRRVVRQRGARGPG